MIFTPQDHQYMARAIKLAAKGLCTTSPNPRVGCVLVKNDQIVGEGFHVKAGQGHAEVNALKQAGELSIGATAYVTLEPCSHYGRTPPCAEGLIKAGVVKVIAAMVDPNPAVSGRGLKMLSDAGIETGAKLLEADAKALNPGFIKLMEKGLPYVRCKLASSIDGKTAMASGESKWITGDKARADVQTLRAQSCAVITGADSVLTDNAKMNVRFSQLIEPTFNEDELRQPLRVVIDSQNRLTPDLTLFSITSNILLIRKNVDNNHQWPAHVEQLVLPTINTKGSEYIDLHALLLVLAKRGLNDVMIESGQRLAGAFIEQNLVDELILYQAAKLMGGDGKSLLAMPSIEQLNRAKKLTFKEVTMVGEDLKITAIFNKQTTSNTKTKQATQKETL